MKTAFLFLWMALLALSGLNAQTTYTISSDGFVYNPSTLTVFVGDIVQFNSTSTHPVLEVSETTWNNNGTTALDGGFSFSDGSGTVSFDAAGTHYYVCTAHVASQGMKGKIIVEVPTGLKEVNGSDKYTIYPVPLSGNELTLALKTTGQEQIELAIYDLTGNLKISSSGITTDGKFLIDCASLPKGLFLIKLKTDNEETYAKLVRE